ncbi:MAG: hypothetical protein DLM68_12155 [Hyphomicrobiales bacterium]|nr:MAG: hypothetical protein DLM68_12155 [Hyphomicrobiales bacterium]
MEDSRLAVKSIHKLIRFFPGFKNTIAEIFERYSKQQANSDDKNRSEYPQCTQRKKERNYRFE